MNVGDVVTAKLLVILASVLSSPGGVDGLVHLTVTNASHLTVVTVGEEIEVKVLT